MKLKQVKSSFGNCYMQYNFFNISINHTLNHLTFNIYFQNNFILQGKKLNISTAFIEPYQKVLAIFELSKLEISYNNLN